jgi:hypothetical protein
MSQVWFDNWKLHVEQRANRLGFSNVYEFANAHSRLPFGQLFRLLQEFDTPTDVPIAYIQFQAAFFEDAKSAGQLKFAIVDTLIRRLRQHLARGWNRGGQIRKRKMDAISNWELPPNWDPDFPVRIWNALNNMNPPDNWCPKDLTDPFIESVFQREWGNKFDAPPLPETGFQNPPVADDSADELDSLDSGTNHSKDPTHPVLELPPKPPLA